MQGADDQAILAEAISLHAVLLTKDKDFGEMVIRRAERCEGVVLIRIEELSKSQNIILVVELLARYEHQLSQHFTVIQEDKIRIRKLE